MFTGVGCRSRAKQRRVHHSRCEALTDVIPLAQFAPSNALTASLSLSSSSRRACLGRGGPSPPVSDEDDSSTAPSVAPPVPSLTRALEVEDGAGTPARPIDDEEATVDGAKDDEVKDMSDAYCNCLYTSLVQANDPSDPVDEGGRAVADVVGSGQREVKDVLGTGHLDDTEGALGPASGGPAAGGQLGHIVGQHNIEENGGITQTAAAGPTRPTCAPRGA